MSTIPTFANPTRQIGDKIIGAGRPVYVTGEIGINHNGELSNAFALIDQAADGRLRRREVPEAHPGGLHPARPVGHRARHPVGPDDLHRLPPPGRVRRPTSTPPSTSTPGSAASPGSPRRGTSSRSTSWRSSTCRPTRSPPPRSPTTSCCARLRATGRTIILSTGMSTPKQIRHAVEVLGSDNIVLCHATSTYPAKPSELNLRMIHTLQAEFPNVPIGYSGHEVGPADHAGRRRPRRHLRRAAHHPRPGHVGLRPGRLGRAARPAAPGPRHPHHRGVPRRRCEEGSTTASSAAMKKLRRVPGAADAELGRRPLSRSGHPS